MALLATCATLSWIGYARIVRRLLTAPESPLVGIAVAEPAADELYKEHTTLKARWKGELDAGQLALFAEVLLAPSDRVRRIMEVVRYSGRAINVTTSVVIDVPHGAALLVPVVMREYGPPNDVLTVDDDQGRRVSLLSRADTAAVCSLVMDGLARYALDAAAIAIPPTAIDELVEAEGRVVRDLLFRSGPGEAIVVQRREHWRDLAREFRIAPEPIVAP